MAPPEGAHDDRLLDALAAIAPVAHAGRVWRVVREGRSPLDGSRGAGRWNPASLSVLYCSLEPQGALAEIHFHLSRGQPVFPSRMRHVLHALDVRTHKILRFADVDALAGFGVERARYQDMLYDRTQAIGAAAAFLGFDGLIAPSARRACANLILFLDALAPEGLTAMSEEPVDWEAWKQRGVRG